MRIYAPTHAHRYAPKHAHDYAREFAPEVYHSEGSVSACLLFASPLVAAGRTSAPGQSSRPLHCAKRRYALGHFGQVSEGPVALARHLAHEPRADQESALDLSRRCGGSRQSRRSVAIVAGQRRQRCCWRAGGRPTARLSPSVRVDALQGQAIPSIPASDLAPFLSTRPLVTETPGGLVGAGKIIAAHDARVVRGDGDYVYAVDIDPKAGSEWYIYRPGKILHSYDSREIARLRNALSRHCSRRPLWRSGAHGDHLGA